MVANGGARVDKGDSARADKGGGARADKGGGQGPRKEVRKSCTVYSINLFSWIKKSSYQAK